MPPDTCPQCYLFILPRHDPDRFATPAPAARRVCSMSRKEQLCIRDSLCDPRPAAESESTVECYLPLRRI